VQPMLARSLRPALGAALANRLFPSASPLGEGPGSRRWFAYEDTLAFRLKGPKPVVVVIHPVVELNGKRTKPWESHLLDAEEGLGLARAMRWDILPGPHDPTDGWDEEALEAAEERDLHRRIEGGAFDPVPEGWHRDRGDGESDDEFDVHEEAWKSPVIKRQYAETCTVKVRRIDPLHYFGKGKIAELAMYVAKNPCDFVFINTTLTPTQSRNLDTVFNNAVLAADAAQRREEERVIFGKIIPSVEVLDRNRVILDIFALRAKTPMAKLQVKMAKMQYMRSRLTLGTQARLRETMRILQEEVGPFKETTTRHTGVEVQYHYETEPFETERKLLRVLEKRLKKLLAKEHRSKEVQRLNRLGVTTIGIVGYTNVGKTALMNALTGSDLKERDLMFQTLDSTMRRLRLPSGRHAIVTDSIGFIQTFPHLMAANFKTTLSELVNCDILLHVRDISHPQRKMHKDIVMKTLLEMGVPQAKLDSSMIEVWNKIDLLPAMDYVPPEAVPICAQANIGVQDLVQVIDVVVNAQTGQQRTVSFPESQMQRAMDFLRKYGASGSCETLEVLEGSEATSGEEALMSIKAVLPDHVWRRWPVEVAGLVPESAGTSLGGRDAVARLSPPGPLSGDVAFPAAR